MPFQVAEGGLGDPSLFVGIDPFGGMPVTGLFDVAFLAEL